MAKEVDDMAAAVANLTDATASLTNLPTCDANLNAALGNAVVRHKHWWIWWPLYRGPHGGVHGVGNPVCANVPAADTAVTHQRRIAAPSVDDIKADVLNCTKFQPIIETAFHDGVCTEAVAGLYYIWQVVGGGGLYRHRHLARALRDGGLQAGGGRRWRRRLRTRRRASSGTRSEYDETGKLMEAAKAVDQPDEEPRAGPVARDREDRASTKHRGLPRHARHGGHARPRPQRTGLTWPVGWLPKASPFFGRRPATLVPAVGRQDRRRRP